MAVREVSIHDSFRLLKTHLPQFLDADVWVPRSWPLPPEGDVTSVEVERCVVMADHLLSVDALVNAVPPLLWTGAKGDLAEWLRAHRGKESTVQGVKGVPTHFVAVEEVAAATTQPSGAEVLSVAAVREGEKVTYQNTSTVVPIELEDVAGLKGLLQNEVLVAIVRFCRALHITDLQCRLGKNGSTLCIMEAQLQLDETAGYLCHDKWGPLRFPVGFGRPELLEERQVHDLDARTGASLKFTLLNRQGRVWTLIAGGGASVVYTDTICEYGFAKELANYGEYSGDPPEEFVYEYAKIILGVMTSSPEPHGKVLLIGGGVANFTDVASTFKGLVRALKEFGAALKACGTSVWVRRGGPNYAEGLAKMKNACEESQQQPLTVQGGIWGPE
eukprot:s722_g1.t1